MSDVAKVNSDLVGSPGPGPNENEGPIRPPREDTELRLGRAAVRQDGHPPRRPWVATYRSLDTAFLFVEYSGDPSQVLLLDRSGGELPLERVERLRRLGDDENSRRLLVDSMHDAGTDRVVGRREVTRREKPFDQRRGARGPGTRMDDETGRLVERDNVIVLI